MTFDITGLMEKETAGRWSTTYHEDKQGDITAKQCTKCGDVNKLDGFNNSEDGLGG